MESPPSFLGELLTLLRDDISVEEFQSLDSAVKDWQAKQHYETLDTYATLFAQGIRQKAVFEAYAEHPGESAHAVLQHVADDPGPYMEALQKLLVSDMGMIRQAPMRSVLLAIYKDPVLRLSWDLWIGGGGRKLTAHEFWGAVHQEDTNGRAMAEESTEITAGSLLAKTFAPIRWFASGLLHEGMVLFGGKSKRGKSWVAMNMAVAMAQGDKVFGQYEVPEPRKVLYGALEDGPRRTQRRLRLMAADPALENLLIAFKMPSLVEGGVEYLAEKIKEGYEVIFVDVLAHLEKAGKNGLPNYHEVYSMFAPLQALRSEHQFALVMITHLRKGESEEVFDALHGSVAYQGTQDALWVMERRMGDDLANVHVRDKDAEDKTIQLRFDGEGTWSYVGEGEEHTATTEESAVLAFLMQEKQPQRVQEIMLGLGIPQSRYAAFRQRLVRMVSKQSILRTDHGKYAALASSGWD